MPFKAVLSPVLFILYTNECRSYIVSINPTLKFAVDIAIQGLIKIIKKNFHTDLKFLNSFSGATPTLQLNVNKTKEMVIDFMKKDTEIMPLKSKIRLIY